MPRKGKRRRIAKSVYADGSGWSAVARAGDLVREQRYEPGTSMKTIRSWQRDTERELRKLLGTPTGERRLTLTQDIETYLTEKTMASIADRERDLRAWIPWFGHRRRHTLRTRELDAQLRRWRVLDRLSASSVNHRRDALSDLFTVLDGPEATNPVKGCIWCARAKPIPQAIDRARIQRVLEAMDPDRKTRWRLSLMHWTGMRPSQMGRLAGPEDFHIGTRAFELEIHGAPRRVPAVLVPSGKGGDPVMFPLTAEGEAVARAFLRTDAFWRPPARQPGAPPKTPRVTWSCPSAYKRIVAAATKIGERPFTVYTIKHSFATALRRTGTDLADIQDMLGHADIASTRIYAPAVNAKHVEALDRLRRDDARRYDHPGATKPTSSPQAAPVSVAPERGTKDDAA
jgi:site-specific recombinase XerD